MKDHPERYSDPVNPHICPEIAQAVNPIITKGDTPRLFDLCALAGVRIGTLVMPPGFGGASKGEDIVCPRYTMGQCTHAGCKKAHLYCQECPRGFATKIATAIAPGVAKYMTGERAKPRVTTARMMPHTQIK